MPNDIPEEDRLLKHCAHKYKLSEQASGFAQVSTDRYVLLFYCEKCLSIRKKIVNVSDQHVSPQLAEEYEDQQNKPDDGSGAV